MKISLGKIFVLVIFLTSIVRAQGANDSLKCTDTAIVILNKFEDFKTEFVKKLSKSHYLNDTLFFVKNRRAKKYGMNGLDAYTHSKMYVCQNKTYFKFFSKDGKRIAEGNWYIEYFWGTYKEYYKNGKLKEQGYYESERKEKQWTYYNTTGKPIKEETYENGKLISTKEIK